MMNSYQHNRKTLLYKTGIILVVLSFVVWVSPLLVPFLPFSTKGKVVFTTGALILAEIMFWIGAAIVGKEAAKKLKKYLNPRYWKKQKNVSTQDVEKNES
jgi:hypothetical protein